MALFVVLLCAVRAEAQSSDRPGSVPPERMVRVQRWLEAVLHHTPGVADEHVDVIGRWSISALRTLWIDLQTLADLARRPDLKQFTVAPDNGIGRSAVVRYQPSEFNRLRTLACAMSGELSPARQARRRNERDNCVVDATRGPEPLLIEIANRAEASRIAGDDNYVLRRGALLQADLAMFGPQPSPGPPSRETDDLGPRRVHVDVTDGQGGDVGSGGIHFAIAYAILKFVVPPGGTRPEPGKDSMVREWYAATSRWMHHTGWFDPVHLQRALLLFPNDAELLFLAACEHAGLAGPIMQSAAKEVRVPPNVTLAIGSLKSELREAESLFRRSLAMNPNAPEARLRLGRVLALQGDVDAARVELRRAVDGGLDDRLEYYSALFLGDVEESQGRLAEARRHYEHAAGLRSHAQAPQIALGQLAHRRGDRAAAIGALARVFDTKYRLNDLDDPWWEYFTSHARDAEARLEELRRPFKESAK